MRMIKILSKRLISWYYKLEPLITETACLILLFFIDLFVMYKPHVI